MNKFMNFLGTVTSKAKLAVRKVEVEKKQQEKADVIEARPWWERSSGFIDGDDCPHVTGQGRVAGRYFRKLQTKNGMFKV